jgi:hypothetical protein
MMRKATASANAGCPDEAPGPLLFFDRARTRGSYLAYRPGLGVCWPRHSAPDWRAILRPWGRGKRNECLDGSLGGAG